MSDRGWSRWDDRADDKLESRCEQGGWFRLKDIPCSTPRMRRRLIAAALWRLRWGQIVRHDGLWRGLTDHEREALFKQRQRVFAQGLQRWKNRMMLAASERMTIMRHFGRSTR